MMNRKKNACIRALLQLSATLDNLAQLIDPKKR